MVPKIKFKNDFKISTIVHGQWRLADWNFSKTETSTFIQQLIELGITTFDHADIYGNYQCESLFGSAFKDLKIPREKIQLISKCGLKLISKQFPERKIKTYDFSYKHIVFSVENSLKNLKTDYLDLLLLHRPSPFYNPEEVAQAFDLLHKSGKVLNFGVSNFSPTQFDTLNSLINQDLVTNQIEISAYQLEHFTNGNIDFFLKNKIKPMAWSPLAGGKLFNPQDEKAHRINTVLQEVANEMDVESTEVIALAWLLNHPCKPIPILGTSKIERILKVIPALNLQLSNEQWFRIYIASTGENLK